MQGFIIDITPYKNEDIFVTILCKNEKVRLYRFYGARHSVVHLGYKIDFTIESGLGIPIARLRNIIHLSYDWNLDLEKMLIWQQYMPLLNNHLKGVDAVESFYFDMLDSCANAFKKQNSKRVLINSYLMLLSYEGRLHDYNKCFFCDFKIKEDIALARGFLPAHPECIYAKGLEREKIKSVFKTLKTINLNENEVNYFWQLLLEGM